MKNDKIIGWTKCQIKSLFSFIKLHPNEPVIQTITTWANRHHKQPFSVRNFYYKLIKITKQNAQTQKVLCSWGVDTKMLLQKREMQDTMQLLEKVLDYSHRRSISAVCLMLANNNTTLAHKLQNKYRNTLSNHPELVEQVLAKLHNQGIPTRITFAPSKIVSMPANKQTIISDQDLHSLVLGVINLIRKNTEASVNDERNKQIKTANNNLQRALIDVRRKNVLLEELKKENQTIKQHLQNIRATQQKLEQERHLSYLTIKQLLDSKKQRELALFVQDLVTKSNVGTTIE